MDYDTFISKKRVIWMMNCIQSAFSIPAQSSVIPDFFRSTETQQHLQQFFGENPPSTKLLIYYQPYTMDNESSYSNISPEPYLFLTTGENNSLQSKAIYFLRRPPHNSELDLTVSSDQYLLTGEVHPNPLHQVKLLIT